MTWQPPPIPEVVEQNVFWILLGLHFILIGAELYMAWSKGWIKIG